MRKEIVHGIMVANRVGRHDLALDLLPPADYQEWGEAKSHRYFPIERPVSSFNSPSLLLIIFWSSSGQYFFSSSTEFRREGNKVVEVVEVLIGYRQYLVETSHRLLILPCGGKRI